MWGKYWLEFHTILTVNFYSQAIFFFSLALNSQPVFNLQDTLRGSLNENRDWFDIKRYVIDVTPNYEEKSIVGVVSWKAIAVKPSKQIQIDLQIA